MAQIPEHVLIPSGSIDLDPDNPNQMSDYQLYQLSKEIEQEGFDEPIKVVAQDAELYAGAGDLQSYLTQGGKFRVIGGNHRVKAGRISGMAEFPAHVKDWDERTAAVKLVTLNTLRGSIQNDLVSALIQNKIGSAPDLHEEFGFKTEDEFLKRFELERRERKKKVERALEERAPSPAEERLETLSSVVAEILSQCSGTERWGFAAFTLRGKSHFLIEMDQDLSEYMGEISSLSEQGEIPLRDLLKGMFEKFHA